MSVGTGDFKQLLYASRDGDFEMVRYYVKRNADLNFLHAEFFYTPLHESIRYQHYEIAEYLLQNGADPHLAEGYTDITPLKIAQTAGDTRAIALLEKYGVEVNRSLWHRLWRPVQQKIVDLYRI